MISAIEEYLLPLGVLLPQIDRDVVGGYFIWLTLPSPLKAEVVATRSKQTENLIIMPGPKFAVYGDEGVVDLVREVRLCFSWVQENLLIEGIQRLARVIATMQETSCQLEMTTATRPV